MSRAGRARAVAALLTLAALLAATGCDTRAEPAAEGLRASGWIPVTDAGSVLAFSKSPSSPLYLVVSGTGGRARLAAVQGSELERVDGAVPAAPADGLTSLDSSGVLIAVAGSGAGTNSARLRLWDVDTLEESEPLAHQAEEPVPRDLRGRPASTLWPLLDTEEEFSAAGVVHVGGRDVIHAWELFKDWEIFDDHDQLVVTAGPASRTVHVDATITTVVVAGFVGEKASAHPTPQVWSIVDIRDESHGRWERMPMASTPDAITDVVAWAVGWWVAGTRDLHPVVYDYDEHIGTAMPVPDTTLDAEHPTVLLAGEPIGEPMTLATQSADGPTVWTHDTPNWTRVAAPSGVLTAAARIDDDVYVVVDGRLWYRKLPVAASASASVATPSSTRTG